MESWNGPFTAVINKYFREELKYENDIEHAIFGDVYPWKRDPEVRVRKMPRRAMTQNPYLHVMVLEGYCGGATDYFDAQYTMSHLDPSAELKDRMRVELYECGHMMYIRKADLAKAKGDLTAFVQSAVPK